MFILISTLPPIVEVKEEVLKLDRLLEITPVPGNEIDRVVHHPLKVFKAKRLHSLQSFLLFFINNLPLDTLEGVNAKLLEAEMHHPPDQLGSNGRNVAVVLKPFQS